MTIREAGSQVKNLHATGLPTVAWFVRWNNQSDVDDQNFIRDGTSASRVK